METVLGIVAGVYLLLAGTMFALQDYILFLPEVPERKVTATPAAIGLAFEVVEIHTADGETLAAWFIPARAGADSAPLTIVHFHGNAGNIGHRLDLARIFAELGYATLLFDYRGYGGSSGAPSEDGTYADAQAVWSYLTRERALPPERIVLHGQSMGAAVAAWLAARERPAALILESTFTSAPDIGAELYPWLPVRLLSRIDYDTRNALARVRSPVLVVHSREDEIIPFHHGQRLFEAAPEPKRMLELQGDHNYGFLRSEGVYREGVRGFLSDATAPR